MTFKHDYQELRLRTVSNYLCDELGWTRRQALSALTDRRLPPWEHGRHSQRRWLVKDVLAFVTRVKQGDAALLGKGSAGGNIHPCVAPS